MDAKSKGIKKVIAVYPGRFQPFGLHHKAVYDSLESKFDDVYIVTSDIKKLPRHPLNFREKQAHMVKMGIAENKISKETTPYAPKNILKNFDAGTTAVVFAVGKKDANRLSSGKYFKEYKNNESMMDGFREHGYVMVAPHVSVLAGGVEVSGTRIRESLGSLEQDEDRESNFKMMFGYFDEKICAAMTRQFKKFQPRKRGRGK